MTGSNAFTTPGSGGGSSSNSSIRSSTTSNNNNTNEAVNVEERVDKITILVQNIDLSYFLKL